MLDFLLLCICFITISNASSNKISDLFDILKLKQDHLVSCIQRIKWPFCHTTTSEQQICIPGEHIHSHDKSSNDFSKNPKKHVQISEQISIIKISSDYTESFLIDLLTQAIETNNLEDLRNLLCDIFNSQDLQSLRKNTLTNTLFALSITFNRPSCIIMIQNFSTTHANMVKEIANSCLSRAVLDEKISIIVKFLKISKECNLDIYRSLRVGIVHSAFKGNLFILEELVRFGTSENLDLSASIKNAIMVSCRLSKIFVLSYLLNFTRNTEILIVEAIGEGLKTAAARGFSHVVNLLHDHCVSVQLKVPSEKIIEAYEIACCNGNFDCRFCLQRMMPSNSIWLPQFPCVIEESPPHSSS